MKQYNGKIPKWYNSDKYNQVKDLFDFNFSIQNRLKCLPYFGLDFQSKEVNFCDYIALDKHNLIFCNASISNFFKKDMYLNDSYFMSKKYSSKHINEAMFPFMKISGCSVTPINAHNIQNLNNQINLFYSNLKGKDRKLWDLYDEEREMINKTPSSQEREDKKNSIRNKGYDLVEKGAIDYRSEEIYKDIADGNYLISINPFAPKKTILEDFTKFINNIKSLEEGIKLNYITQKRLNKWLKYKVLEFVDLKIWFNHKGVKITDFELGSIIYENDNIDVVTTIRKHTKKYVNEVLSRKWLRLISQQVFTNLKKYSS